MTNLASSNTFLTATTVSEKENEDRIIIRKFRFLDIGPKLLWLAESHKIHSRTRYMHRGEWGTQGRLTYARCRLHKFKSQLLTYCVAMGKPYDFFVL